jgi:hypothetical protein
MIVEIKHIDTEALGAVLAGLDELGHQELTNIFARWAFELEWLEVPDLGQERLELVSRCFDAACRSYSIRFTVDGTTHEFTKREVQDEIPEETTQADHPEPAETQEESEDEPADDLQTPEELHEEMERCATRETIKHDKKGRKYRKKKVPSETTETVQCHIDRLETEQREDIVNLIREAAMPTLAARIAANETAFMIPKPRGGQISRLRHTLDALCTSYKLQVGAVRLISS